MRATPTPTQLCDDVLAKCDRPLRRPDRGCTGQAQRVCLFSPPVDREMNLLADIPPQRGVSLGQGHTLFVFGPARDYTQGL